MAFPNYHVDDISFVTLKKELSGYSWETCRQDLTAGISVALLTVPQAMGYSILAGLPLFCGLLAAIYSSLIAAIFGSSRHLVVGPSTALAILVQTGTAEILFTYYRDLSSVERDAMAVQILTQLTFLVGMIQILAAGCKLGRLTQFVSHSVVVGYMSGLAIAVVINQLFPFLGISRLSGVHSFYERGAYLFTHLNYTHFPTAIIGLGSFVLMVLLKKIDKRIPAAVITFAVAGTIVHMLGWSEFSSEAAMVDPFNDETVQKVALIGDTGAVFDVIPFISLPYFDTGIMNSILPVAFALALLSIMESVSVAKSIAACSGQRLSVNQEIFGIGLGNTVSSLISGMPVSGSPSRSGLNFNYGAQTRLSAIFSAVSVAVFLFSFGELITLIPLASLAALLLYTAVNIVNPKQFFLCLKATSSDAFVLWLTMLSCIFFSLDVAFYIGIAISITLYLKKSAIPQLVEYDIDDHGDLKNIDFSKKHDDHKKIRVIKVEGELFFGAADLFQTTLKAIAEDDTSTRVIMLQLKNARDIDATACLALEQLYDYLKGSGRHLILCGLTWQIWEVLSDSGIVELIGKENLFVFDEKHPHHYMQKALSKAKELAQETITASARTEAVELHPKEVLATADTNIKP